MYGNAIPVTKLKDPTVKELTLEALPHADEDAVIIAALLAATKSITAVNLPRNHIGDVGAYALAQVLQA